MFKNTLRGLGVALITPFCNDGSVDFDAMAQLIEYQLKNGVDYFVVLGTTAETPTLTESEKSDIVHFVINKVNGRVPLVVGLGGNNTQKVIDQLHNNDFTGISAILSVVPYYNKPSQEGIYQHFANIAKHAPVPIILYNVPGRTGTNMTAETTLRLANDFTNIVAIKEASGNLAQIDNIIKNAPKHFSVISGDDGIAFPLINLGAIGVISVIGNAFPKEFSRMIHLSLNGDYENARIIHQHFTEIIKLLFVEGNPAGIKSMLAAMGYINNKLRLPLVPNTIKTYEKIRQVLFQLNIKP